MNKISLNFCRTGNDLYLGIKKLLCDFFSEKLELTREELVEKIQFLKEDENVDIFVYKSWSGSYDFIRFVTTKVKFLTLENNRFRISELGIQFHKLLISKEDYFRDELFKHTYLISMTKATRFRDFCDYLKINVDDEGLLSKDLFRLAKKKVLYEKQFSNLNAIRFLEDIHLINLSDNHYVKVNLGMLALINPEEIAMKIIKGNLDTSKQLELKRAQNLLIEHRIDPTIIETLRDKEKLIVRGIRTGKFIDFS